MAKLALAVLFLGLMPVLMEVDFSNTVTTGALITSLFVIVAAGFFSIRANSAKIWRDNFDAEKGRNDVLNQELKDAKDLIGEQKKIIAQLESLPNLERVINLMSEQNKRSDDRANERVRLAMGSIQSMVENLERRAEERHRLVMKAITKEEK